MIIKKNSFEKLIKIIQDMELPYLRISLSSQCNAECVYCHNEGQRERSNNNISLKKYIEVAKLFASYFTRVVFTGGEPLLASNLFEVIKIFKSYDYKVGLTTNGILLDEKKQKSLFDVGLDTINISLNSLDKEKYSRFYKVDKFSILKGNLEILNKYFNYPNKKINWIVTDETNFDDEIPNLSKLSKTSLFIISPIFDIEFDNEKVMSLLNILKEKLYCLYGKPVIKEKNEYKRQKEYFEFYNKNIWEFDNLQTEKNSFSLKNNNFCKNCLEDKKNNCYEGAYALRISASGIFRPCLKRTDNNFTIDEVITEE